MKNNIENLNENARNHVGAGLDSARDHRGITLIALIITVIVLLILAGVALNFVIGENGILRHAEFASNKYQNSAEKEENELAQLDSYISANRDTVTIDKEEYEKLKQNSIKFIDYTNVLTTITSSSAEWTATEDCAVIGMVRKTDDLSPGVFIDGICAFGAWTNDTNIAVTGTIYVKKDSVISTRNSGTYNLTVFGLMK